jgi:DNA-binding beta-propeller fold protein YncE
LKTSRIAQLAILTVLSGLLPVLGQAATSPLNYPYGLAINASGDLYVANTSGNNILIYSPSHLQTGSITQGTSGPNGVAVDPSGNLWVANGLSNSVTNYSPAGIQNTSATITSGVNNPTAIAVDGLSDVLIVNTITCWGFGLVFLRENRLPPRPSAVHRSPE